MSRGSTNEVPALIEAVKEHQKFRQLACYSIECLSKVIDPTNRDFKKNLAVAHASGAGKCVVDVLKRHPGKEDVLLVCCDCLRKLAADTANAEIIAEEGCVDAILASLAANPELPDDVLTIALSILDDLCNHNKALQTLVSRDTVANLIKLLSQGGQKSDVQICCVRALTKLTKIPKGLDDFLQGEGFRPMIATMQELAAGPMEEESGELAALHAGCTMFTRLCNKDSAHLEAIKAAGGQEMCLAIMETCKDPQLCKICSKMLAILCGSDSIDSLITSLRDQSSLSVQVQEHMLGLLSSLSMDSASSSDIVKSGGVKVLVQSCEAKISARQLETSTRTLLRLASSNSQSVRELVQDGAVQALIGAMQQQALAPDASDQARRAHMEIISNALQALTHISAITEHVAVVCEAGGVGAVLGVLALEKDNAAIAAGSLAFLQSLCGHGVLEDAFQSTEIDLLLEAMCTRPDDSKLVLAALKVFIELATSDSMLQTYLSKGMVEVVLGIIQNSGDDLDILREALYLLSTLLLDPSALEMVNAAFDGTGLDIVMGAISSNTRDDSIRKVAAELIVQLSSDEMIMRIIQELNALAEIAATTSLDASNLQRVANLALAIGALSMVPENLSRIASAGGIAPMIALLSAMANIHSNDEAHRAALKTLCGALEEIIAYGDALASINVRATVEACVSALQRHAKVTPIVLSALRLLAVISATPLNKALCIECDVLSAVSTVIRTSATNRDILTAVVNVFVNLSSAEDEIAMAICTHNASKMVIHCINENLVDNEDTVKPVLSLLRVLHRLATIPEGCDILRRQGCLTCVFDALECFRSSEDIARVCLDTIQIVLQDGDVESTLSRLMKKVNDPNFFGLQNASVDLIEKALADMKRLGLLMLCGEHVVEVVEASGGVVLIQNCLAGFSPSANTNVCESSLVSRARDEFVDACIEALGRAALGNADIAATIAAVPLLVQAAQNNPTAAVFNTIKNLASLHESVLAALAQGGATAVALEICHSGNYPDDVMAAAFSCLSVLALDPTGLHVIVESNATDLVCSYLTDSLMSEDIGASNIDTIKSAVSVLLALARAVSSQSVNAAIVRALSEVIEALCSMSKNATGKQKGLYPALLASTMDVVVALLQSTCADSYLDLLIGNGDIAKLDHLMPARDDAYLKMSLPCHSVADMMSLVMSCSGEKGLQCLQDLGSQEYFLRAMNFHPADMVLQKKLAHVAGALGLEGALSSLASFIEQIDALVAGYSAEAIPQLSQYMQLIGNLMLLDNALSPDMAENLLNSFLNACAALLMPVEGSQSERDEALQTCVTCMGKLLSMDNFTPSEGSVYRVLEFAVAMLRDCDAYQIQAETKVSILRVVRSIVNHTSSGATVAWQLGMNAVLQSLTPGVALLTATGQAPGAITAAIFTEEKNKTIAAMLSKLIENLSILQTLANAGVDEVCDVLCCQSAQSPGPLYWKGMLEAIRTHASLGYRFLLDILSELHTPLTAEKQRSQMIVDMLSKAICDILVDAITRQELLSFDTSAHIAAVVTGCMKLLPDCSLMMFDCLANTPDGAYALVTSPELLQYLLDALNRPEDCVFASTIITKIASHEVGDSLQILVKHGLSKQILAALRGNGQNDEAFSQNAVYILRVFADAIGISDLRLPKDTIRLMKELVLRFSHNEYLVSVATSISEDLTHAFAIGPESQLEGHLAALPGIAAAIGQWVAMASEDGNVYFYNGGDGTTQWESPLEYTALRSEMADIADLVERLDNVISDVNVPVAAMDTMYGLLQSHYTDAELIAHVMKFIHAQTVSSATASLESISEDQGLVLISSLQAQLAATIASDDTRALEAALEITEALCKLKKLQASLTGEEYIRVLCETCRAHLHLPTVLIKGFSTLTTLAAVSPAASSACLKYDLHTIIVQASEKHLPAVTSAEVVKMASSTAPSDKKYTLTRSNTTLIADLSAPINLCFTTIGLLLSLMVHEDAGINLMLCTACTDMLLAILRVFSKDTLFMSRLLVLLGKYSMDDACVDVMIHRKCVVEIATVAKEHISNAALMKVVVELFANLASLEPVESEDEAYKSPNEIMVDEGAVDFIVSVMKKHEDKPTIACAALDALYNAIDSTSALDIAQSGAIDAAFNAFERYDYDRNVTNAVIQAFVLLTDFGVALTDVCGESGDRLAQVMHVMEANLGDDELLKGSLRLLLNVFVVKENRDLLAESGGVNSIFSVIAMHSDNGEVISLCVTLLARLSVSDSLSEAIAEKGCRQFMDMITTFIEDTAIVADVFALLGQLAFIKSNLKSIVQYGGVKILLDIMTVFGDEELLMVSAVRTLDNIISADEEYANIVIDKGGKEAVEKVKSLHSKDCEDLHEVCASALLSISARSRAKGRVGTKTNKGALFARLNDVIDVDSAMKRENEEVKSSSLNTDMEDPLSAQHRTLLRAGQMVSDYQKGSATSRHLFLSSDCQFVVLKDTSNKVNKPGRKIPLKNLQAASQGYGAGHYKKALVGGLKTSAVEGRCLFVSSNTAKAEDEITIEFATQGDRDKWFDVFTALLLTATACPHFLRSL